VAKASYVDPRVVDLFRDGTTIAAILADLGGMPNPEDAVAQQAVEAAVREMLRTGEEPDEVARVIRGYVEQPSPLLRATSAS
jgi:hypothetical protein